MDVRFSRELVRVTMSPTGRRAGFSLLELMVVVLIGGIMATVSVGGYQSANDRARNTSTVANVNTVREGVERYLADNESCPVGLIGPGLGDAGTVDEYLLDDTLPPQRRTVTYLGGKNLPRSPFGTAFQGNTLQIGSDNPALANDDVIHKPFVNANQLLLYGAKLNSSVEGTGEGQEIGAGLIPPAPDANQRAFFAPNTYGAIHYGKAGTVLTGANNPLNPGVPIYRIETVYVLAGTGKRNGKAIMVGVVSNFVR